MVSKMSTNKVQQLSLSRHLILLLLLVIIQTSSSINIAGYIPEYRFYIDLESISSQLSHLILFSIQPRPNGAIAGSCCLDSSHYASAKKARDAKDVDKTKLMVSVGGAGRSDSFSSITANSNYRKNLIEKLIKLCSKHSLAGVDYDWETPPQSTSAFTSYLTLLRETHDAFQAHHLLVTVALHPNQYLPKDAYQFLDYVHVMTYDMIAGGGRGGGGGEHHATFENVVNAVNGFLKRGAPPEKVMVGIPAYARHGDNPGMVKTYSEIVDMMKDDNDVGGGTSMDVDDLEDVGEFQGYLFDSPADVKRKVNWVKERGLAGVFFWEVGQDSSFVEGGVLISAAAGHNSIHTSSSSNEL